MLPEIITLLAYVTGLVILVIIGFALSIGSIGTAFYAFFAMLFNSASANSLSNNIRSVLKN
jgi:hypothetical protein